MKTNKEVALERFLARKATEGIALAPELVEVAKQNSRAAPVKRDALPAQTESAPLPLRERKNVAPKQPQAQRSTAEPLSKAAKKNAKRSEKRAAGGGQQGGK